MSRSWLWVGKVCFKGSKVVVPSSLRYCRFFVAREYQAVAATAIGRLVVASALASRSVANAKTPLVLSNP